ncbi:MAG: FliI/YscN family ATPase [Pirellulales bacterium]|nr:FliI/YscN family ATPase [Pirellulales bacterium]
MEATLFDNLNHTPTASLTGTVSETIGMTVVVADFPAPVGAVVRVEREAEGPCEGEVVGFRDGRTLVYLQSATAGVRRGNKVRMVRAGRVLKVGEGLLGRVLDAHGTFIDGRPQPLLTGRARIDRQPPPATERPRIREPLSTGVHAIDSLLTCGRGQRLGIFAGSGVGKSVLLGMMTRNTNADVIVTGLIGERGREVNEFLDRDLGVEGMKRSVVVVATSNESALTRLQAASTATAIAEYFRDQGKQVLLLMDSVTRFAMAQREIGLAAGEPPTTRGYPPSMYALLPRLVERAGQTSQGSITAFYTVLVEGDDENEPVADTMRGLLDGHVWLSRKLATRGHYPAIDILSSISRVMKDITSPQHQAAAQTIRKLLSVYAEHEDLLSIGAYRRGSNRTVDVAVEMRDAIETLLRQPIDSAAPYEKVVELLIALAEQCQVRLAAPATSPAIPIQGAAGAATTSGGATQPSAANGTRVAQAAR